MIKIFLPLLLFSMCISTIGRTQTQWENKNLYKYIVNLSNGTLPIKKNGKWGLVDSNDIIKVKIEYDSIFAAGEGVCILKKGNKHLFINDQFQILYETSDSKLEFMWDLWKISNKESEEFLVCIDKELKVFNTKEDYQKYLIDYETTKTIKSSTTNENPIDTVLKLQDKDSIYLIIQYSDGEQIITEKTKKIQFNDPYFLTYSTFDNSYHERIINLEKREINNIESGILKSTLIIEDHIYLIIYKATYCEVVELETGKVCKTKYLVTSFGELLISHTHDKNSYEIINLPENKLLFSGLANVNSYNDYLTCVDTLGFISFINSTGEVFYKVKIDDLVSHEIFIRNKEIENTVDSKLVRIRTNQNKYILVSTNGDVFYDGQQSIHWRGGNTLSFSLSHGRDNITQVGFLDFDKKSLVLFNHFEDIKFITTNLYAVKLPSTQRSEDKWGIINRNGQLAIQQHFNSIDIIKYAASADFFLRLALKDSIIYYDKNLIQHDVKFDKKIRIKRIKMIHSELEEGDLSFAKLVDTESKFVKGIIDFDFNTIYLDDVKDIYYNPNGKYFFLITDQGDFGYMRTNGIKLF